MVITVQCPECSTSFPVDPAKVPVGGVKARCSSCSAIFRVERPEEASPPPSPPAIPVEPAEPLPEPSLEAELEPEGDAAPEEAMPVATPEPTPAPPLEADFEPEGDAAPEASTPVSTPEPAEDSESTDSEWETTAVGDAPEAPASAEDWVFETEEDIDPSSLMIEPVGTLEESLESAKDEVPSFGSDLTVEGEVESEPTDPLEDTPADSGPGRWEERPSQAADFLTAPDSVLMEPGEAADAPPAEAEPFRTSEPPPAEEPATGPAVTGFTFGRRDPHDKARRLARVLVSDIITYNPDRHRQALSSGSLKEDFEEEIEKSWKEYVEQVGPEIAGSTPYWSEALNDVLAKGQQIF